ncbi:MAG TPA: two-component regulator propeller domain-containing protein [Verrucomicrobiae bacterium]|jgi:ligand-binding sensor domain-containing protein/signal transduction histidine kinase|nr:two-component regulator propeller domain-containing protein [Verrucomicrobiae bacterium]
MSKNCRAIAATLLLCLAFSGLVRAAQTTVRPDSPYVVDVWGVKDGLPGSAVISVVQARSGYLWFATLYGLVRFDGVKFTTFDEGNTPGLDSSRIVYVFEDSRSNLWVGTESAGVIIIDRAGQIQKVKTSGDLPAVHPVSACEDSDGTVWLLMKDGRLCSYRDQRLEFVGMCKSAMTETNGQLWLGTDQGAFPILKASAGARAFVVGQTVPVKHRLDFLLASKKGGFWMIADGRVQKWKDHELLSDWETDPWHDTPVTTACEDAVGNLIVGTYGDGIYWFNSNGTATHLSRELSLNYVQSIVVDHEGSLWVGTDGGGLDRVKQKDFASLPASTNSVVQSVATDKHGGLWIAYNENRIDHWNNGAYERFAPVSISENPAGASVKAVFVDKDARVFAGVSGSSGPRLFEFQNNKFSPVPEVNLRSDVSAIYQDHAGRIWVGTREGLLVFSGQTSRTLSVAEGLPNPDVRAIAGDAEGNLWIGTGGGLACLRGGTLSVFHKKDGLPSEDISSLLVDADGVLWIGTRGSGLARFAKNQWTHYTTGEGLAGNSIDYLLEDNKTNLWLGSNTGLMLVAKKSLNDFANGVTHSVACRAYVEEDGLPTRECTEGSQPAGSATADGTLWFPTTRGLVSVNPSALKRNPLEPRVIIESVSVEGQPQNTNRFGGSPAEIIVPPGKGHLDIHYASLNLGAADRSRFKYRLSEQGGTAWTDDETGNRVASYPKLTPGDYQFEVTACNEDGVWNTHPVSLTVIVQPALWQKASFRGAVAVGVLALIAGIVYYFSTQKLQRQLVLLRQQEALEHERARIARDLHDQLGANLTQVALLAEMAESDKEIPAEVEDHARQITQTARETTKALDEIVWAINPSNDTLEGLVNYSGKYAQEYFALAGLRYRVDIPNQLPEVNLPPEVRHNVFLAFKESVNNVVKHAQAQEAHVRLKLDQNCFTLEIEDNGRGPAGAEQKSDRNGLRNMRKRMEDVGGTFSIGPAAGQGTIVRLTAPIKMRGPNAH